MTFSIAGRCERTGMFGLAITTSSICVGARCPHARATVGAVATQNITDPTFGPRILDHLANRREHLAERLLRALEAGLQAGGESGLVHSAALLVVDAQPFPLVDLRCDWDDDDPVAFLRRLWSDYAPQMEAYRIRALDPTQAPSYGVAGDR